MIKFQPVIKWSGSKRSQCEDILEYVGDFTYVSKVKVDDKVKINSKEYVIKGVEKISTSRFVGLIIGGDDVDNIDNFFGKEIEI